MQIYALGLLLVASAFHSLSDAAEESLAPAPSNHESQHNAGAPSRVKRGQYELNGLTRGLNILRLGKRASPPDYPQYEEEQDIGDSLALENPSPYIYDISPEEYYEALNALQTRDSHSRYRRSTPAGDVMVTPVPFINDDEDALIGDDSDGLKIDGDDEYLAYPEFSDDSVIVDDMGKAWNAQTGMELTKRGLNMLRLGKRQGESSLIGTSKRALNMFRLGKRERDSSHSAIGTSKKRLNMLRLGKREGDSSNSAIGTSEKRLNMLRLGKRETAIGTSKKALNMLRLGKRQRESLNSEFATSKKALNMLRLGKREDDIEKRNMRILRLGKRNLSMLRLGKRQLNMLRLGKRQLNMLRLGKRQLNMFRLGKREDPWAGKRNLNMLRLGKRSVDDVPADNQD